VCAWDNRFLNVIQSEQQNTDTLSSFGYIKHYEVYIFSVDGTKFCAVLMPCEILLRFTERVNCTTALYTIPYFKKSGYAQAVYLLI